MFLWFGFIFPQSCNSGVLLFENSSWPIVFPISWEKVLPNIWLCLASVILGKTQLDCCFPAYAKILCSFSRLIWKNALGTTCSEEPGRFYQGGLSPLTCFFCPELTVYCSTCISEHNTQILSPPLQNTEILVTSQCSCQWLLKLHETVTTSWEIWGGEEVEYCCFCVSFLC